MKEFYDSIKLKRMFFIVVFFIAIAVVPITIYTLRLENVIASPDISAVLLTHLVRLHYALAGFCALVLGICFVLLKKYSGTILDSMVKDKIKTAGSEHCSEPLMRRELKNAEKNSREFVILMVAVDNFKTVSDMYGPNFGDTVLTAVSQTIMRSLRPDDKFISCGAEKFAVLIPNVPIETVCKFAESICVSIENIDIYNEDWQRAIRVTISIGVAHSNSPRLSSTTLVENANEALQKAEVSHNAVSLFIKGNSATKVGTLTQEEINVIIKGADNATPGKAPLWRLPSTKSSNIESLETRPHRH